MSRVEAFEDETAIVVNRFDRVIIDRTVTRVHQEDLCQALAITPARKYQSDGGPSPGQVAELLRSVIPGSDAETDVWRFADALAFNWLIAGTDAHAKNYGLLLAGAQIRMAPLYDIASYLPYDDSHGHQLRLAMKIGGEYRVRGTDRVSAWEHTADELKLNRATLIERVRALASRVPDAFERTAADEAQHGLETDLPERLLERVSERSAHCLSALG